MSQFSLSSLVLFVSLPSLALAANVTTSNSTLTGTIVVVNDTLLASQDGRVRQWISQPDYRGTWDLIRSCLATIFICTYTLLCLNVPASTDSFWKLARRRLLWMSLAVAGPEIVLTYAAGQWSRARQSVDAFHQLGFHSWNMRLAFFADMGGFVLQADGVDPFPLNAKQLAWLVESDYVNFPESSEEEIWDKSKQDNFAKIVSSFQAGYMLLQVIGRAAQGLAVTTLELNTVAIVICSLMTAFAWLHKPSDIRSPLRLIAKAPMNDITRGRPWKTTPLDFVDENGPGWAMNIQPFMRLPTIPEDRPIQMIPNDRFPTNPHGTQEYLLCVATLIFASIHVGGWNFVFPSSLEQILWRVSSMLLFGVTIAFWIFETCASWVRLRRWQYIWLYITEPEKLPDFYSQRNERLNEKHEPTQLPLPWEAAAMTPIILIYAFARLYLIVEAFLELRDLQVTAYLTVNWSRYIPHV